jgi:hypothetical protein
MAYYKTTTEYSNLTETDIQNTFKSNNNNNNGGGGGGGTSANALETIKNGLDQNQHLLTGYP